MGKTSSVVVCALMLGACGGGPEPAGPARQALTVQHAVGGPALDLCVTEDEVLVLYPLVVERWQVDPPAPVGRAVLDQPRAKLTCGEAVAAGSVRGDSVAGRQVALKDGGWVLRDGESVLLERQSLGAPQATAVDPEAVWAADGSALWRWVPGPARPLRVALPDPLVGQTAQSLFFQGHLLWFRVAPDQGHPLNVDGATAKYVGPPSKLGRIPTDPLVLPVQGRLVRLTLGQAGATVDGEAWALPAATAVLPWQDGLLVATADGIGLWDVRDRAAPVAQVALPGTRALYDAAEGFVAVGDYGLAVVTRSSPPPPAPASAP